MARLERYNDDEIATLLKLVKENSASSAPLSVAELASVAESHLVGRSADAIKQRIFKMQREGTKPKRVAAKKPAAHAAPRRPAKPTKPKPTTPTPDRKPARNGHTNGTTARKPLPEGLILTLPGGAQVTGRPSQIAELVKQL